MGKKSNVLKAYVAILLKSEGGYVNDPDDPGAETYCGISREHHPDWKGWESVDKEKHPIEVNTIFSDLQDDVIDFYNQNYIKSNMNIEGIAKLNIGLGMQVLDFGVNAGASRSAKLLQRLLHVSPDGKVGKNTLAAIAQTNTDELAGRFRNGRLSYYTSLSKNHMWAKKFLYSWKKRIRDCSADLYENITTI